VSPATNSVESPQSAIRLALDVSHPYVPAFDVVLPFLTLAAYFITAHDLVSDLGRAFQDPGCVDSEPR